MPFKCCVLGCNYEGKNGLHSFPSDPAVAAQWIEISKVKNSTKLKDRSNTKTLSHSYYNICKKHFLSGDYDPNFNGDVQRLKKGVVPSQCLPNMLLLIEREHNYSPVPKKRARVEQQYEEKAFGTENHIHTNDNGMSDGFFDDFLSCMEVGANADVQLEEISDRKLQGSSTTAGGSESEADVDKITEELNCYKAKCDEYSKIDKWTDDNVVKYLSKKFNKQQLELFKIQINNSGIKINARRYSDDQKSLCLSLYKQSPKKYRFLRRFLILPGKSTLGRHRAHLVFQAGIDPKLLGMIKLKVNEMSEEDKLSVLCFDEVALKVHIDFDKSKDVIDGFVDMNGLRRPDFATHALTFMVRGIQTPYKEPVAFNYTANLKAVELSGLVKVTTEAVLDTGLNLIGSVCDQPPTCSAAVHDLIQPGCEGITSSGQLLRYKVLDHWLIHVYDVPHIWKVLRNNMLVKDLCHTLFERWEITDCKHFGVDKKYATWDHVVQLYHLKKNSTQRLELKLTPEHINPDKEKMKVANATQVFSETVGNAMLRCADKKQLPTESADTALVLLFFNDLFDSLNGGGVPQYESLKGSIDAQSVHFAYWNYALSVVQNMNFVDKSTRNVNNRSTVLKKLESTIRGYMEITKICLNSGVSEFAVRNTNQDGLENFFGCCKALCGAKPIATHYRSAYTTMVVNNLIGPVSKGSNCEEDKFFALLSNINKMLLDFGIESEQTDETDQTKNAEAVDISKEDEDNILETIVFDPFFGDMEFNFVESESISNSSGSICRQLMEVTVCHDCRLTLQEPSSQLDDDELNIILPSQVFKSHFEKLFCAINVAIPHFCHEKSVKKKIISQLEKIQEFPIGCEAHRDDIAVKLMDITTNYALHSFCNIINNTLSGKVLELPVNCNHMQEKAFLFRQKKRGIGKHSDKFIE